MTKNTVYRIKRHDTWPPLRATLIQADGAALKLDGATVWLIARTAEGQSLRKPVDIIDAQNGRVECRLSAVDTGMPARYRAEFEVTFSDGQKTTVPNDDYFSIVIVEDLG